MLNSNKARLELLETISASQIESLHILALTNQELQVFLHDEFMENPMLEYVEETAAPTPGEEEAYERELPWRREPVRKGEDYNTWNNIPAYNPDEEKQNLLMQLGSGYSDQEFKIFEFLIECLDENGYFPYDLHEVAAFSGLPYKLIQKCYHTLSSLEPVGIFSRNLSECLLKQICHAGITDEKLHALVRDHLHDLVEGHCGKVARKLGLSPQELRGYIDIIRKFEPRPIAEKRQATEYVVPDLIVSCTADAVWEVIINDNWMGECRFNDYYIHMMRSTEDRQLKQYFKGKLERARLVVECVEQRRATLMRVVKSILDYQKDYFTKGGSLNPMLVNDVAADLGMHPSTISRAIKGKYLQYPRGVVLLRDLFSLPVKNKETGNQVSCGGIMAMIRSLVEKEDKTRPLSDQSISRLLASKNNIQISRRTVAKYRIKMGIPDSNQRRYLAR